jgi:hypothetical protein
LLQILTEQRGAYLQFEEAAREYTRQSARATAAMGAASSASESVAVPVALGSDDIARFASSSLRQRQNV